MSSFQGVGIEGSTVYRGVFISGGWSRGVPLYTEVSSFQEVGIEEFHRCPHFKGLSSRGVLISWGWNRRVPLYTEVSSFQGVGIEEFHCIQRCPYFRGLE